MIFPVLEVERTVQFGDKTRLSGVKSFASKGDTVQSVSISPNADTGFIEITGNQERDWYLDWIYQGLVSQDFVVTLQVVANGQTAQASKTISLTTPQDDRLFATDQDLAVLEPNILKYVVEGRSSYLDVHREAKSKILEVLTDRGMGKVTDTQLVDKKEVRTWARDLALSLIFQGMNSTSDDVFLAKAKFYRSAAEDRQARAMVSLDLNGDGVASEIEQSRWGQITSGVLRR